jgi:hypothetical protein
MNMRKSPAENIRQSINAVKIITESTVEEFITLLNSYGWTRNIVTNNGTHEIYKYLGDVTLTHHYISLTYHKDTGEDIEWEHYVGPSRTPVFATGGQTITSLKLELQSIKNMINA